jgi:hypothetical protein
MIPNSTNARRKIDNFASRAAGNGARIRRETCCRNQVSVLKLVHKHAISRASPVGAPWRGHQRAPGSGQAATSVLQKHYREPLIASAVGGMTPLQNYPQQHRGEATNRQIAVRAGSIRARIRILLGKYFRHQGLGSNFGPHTFYFKSNSGPGWGTTWLFFLVCSLQWRETIDRAPDRPNFGTFLCKIRGLHRNFRVRIAHRWIGPEGPYPAVCDSV